jgi:hypothetical protein
MDDGTGAAAPIAGETPPLPAPAFPIVGVGAFAGGLEAFEAFFRACPADTGIALVLVPHLDPGHVSLLTEILRRSTAMPVVEALDEVAVAPNHVYVIPPNREMAILNGVLQLSMPELVRGQRMPIDGFLRSLAEDQGERAIGIILSGTATDGTLGLRAILGGGGVCMVQEPSTAKYDGMPSSAINAGYATHILAVEDMPATLLEVARQAVYRQRVPPAAPEKVQGAESLVLEDVADTIAKMQAIKQLGVCFSMDDFGTGYSSLSYLAQLPLDQIKIDRSFVRNLPGYRNDETIARAIITMGRGLDIHVIAEGVETKAQIGFLEAHGCHAFQGYLFSRPLPLEDIEEFLRRV